MVAFVMSTCGSGMVPDAQALPLTRWGRSRCAPFVIIACVLFSGCQHDPIDPDLLHPSASAAAEDGAKGEKAGTKTRFLEHDLGFVRAGEIANHSFEIRNDSSIAWTVKGIDNACNCTVAKVSARTLQPGDVVAVQVDYAAPRHSVNDRRQVSIFFSEVEAPSYVLTVRATVRASMTLEERNISLTQLGVGKSRRSTFGISNYGTNKWSSLRVFTTAPWLSFETKQYRDTLSDPNLRQLWTVDMTTDASSLEVGEHTALVTIEARNQRGDIFEKASVHVTARVTASFGAIPRHIFIGEVCPNKPSTATISVYFSEDSIPSSVSDVEFHHELGSAIDLAWMKTTGRIWKLRVTLRSSARELVDQKIVMTVPSLGLPAVSLPLYAYESKSKEGG